MITEQPVELENGFQMIMSSPNSQATTSQQPQQQLSSSSGNNQAATDEQRAAGDQADSFSQMNINSFNQLVGQSAMGDFLLSTVSPQQQSTLSGSTLQPTEMTATSSSADQQSSSGGPSTSTTTAITTPESESSTADQEQRQQTNQQSGGDNNLANSMTTNQQQQSTPSSLSMSLDGMIVNSRPRSESIGMNRHSGLQTSAPTSRIGELEPVRRLRPGAGDSLNQVKASRRVPFTGAPFISPASKGHRSKPKSSNQFIDGLKVSQLQQTSGMRSPTSSSQQNQLSQPVNTFGGSSTSSGGDQFRSTKPQQQNNGNQFDQLFGMPAIASFLGGNNLDSTGQLSGDQASQQQRQQQQTLGFDLDDQLQSGARQQSDDGSTPAFSSSTARDNSGRQQTTSELRQNNNLLMNAQPIVNNDMVMSVVSSPDGKDRRIVMVARNTLDALQRFANAAAAAPQAPQTLGRTPTTFFSSSNQPSADNGKATDSSLVTGTANNWWPSMSSTQGWSQSPSTSSDQTGKTNQFETSTRTTQSPSPGQFISMTTTSNPVASSFATTTPAATTMTPTTKAPTSSLGTTLSGFSSGAEDEIQRGSNATQTFRQQSDGFREVPTLSGNEPERAADQQLESMSPVTQNQKPKTKTTQNSSGNKTNSSKQRNNNATKTQSKKKNNGSTVTGELAPTNGTRQTTSSKQQTSGKPSQAPFKSTNGSPTGGLKAKSSLSSKQTKTQSASPVLSTKRVQGASQTGGSKGTNAQQPRPVSLAGTSGDITQSNSRRPSDSSGDSSSTKSEEQSQITTNTPSSTERPTSRQPAGGRKSQNTQEFGSVVVPMRELNQRPQKGESDSTISADTSTGDNALGEGPGASQSGPEASMSDLDKQLDELERGTGNAGNDQSVEPKRGPMSAIDGLRASIPGEPRTDYPIYSAPPKTSFDCKAQSCPGGYYADTEAQCQVFHICQSDGRSDTFLCPNGTIFSQQHFVCVWWWQIDCQQSASFYKLNNGIYCDSQFSPLATSSGGPGSTSSSPTLGAANSAFGGTAGSQSQQPGEASISGSSTGDGKPTSTEDQLSSSAGTGASDGVPPTDSNVAKQAGLNSSGDGSNIQQAGDGRARPTSGAGSSSGSQTSEQPASAGADTSGDSELDLQQQQQTEPLSRRKA